MRAFDDICVRPGVEEPTNSDVRKTLVAASILGAAVFAGYSVWLGRIPEVPGLDTNSVRYVARLAGLRP
ncbi:hypothetical protein BDW22DRAFT_1428182 [Trametopsis cervina]|nr:hypothetical protein BDW22DRAFT_1428182 [Trametopsis cervina]